MLLDDTLVELDSASFLPPRNKSQTATKCWELGGIALSDTSEPMQYYWYGYVKGKAIYLQRSGVEPIAVLAFAGDVTEMSFSFDQNMRPTIAYVENGVAKLYWYDSSAAKNVLTLYPTITNPRLSLDDKRKFNIGNSDIIFAYVSDHNRLCYRLQRERYGAEHVLLTDTTKSNDEPLTLSTIGMSTSNRFLFLTN
ncbi:hypothetical protein [uncultured Psychrobacter sp.]|uniref:hypothetical protein n=1 Tax=uncultured Psychrobacter sp. TaxID=259303 RepID=UPI0032B197AC|tara:strand:- start:1866 stop:2450 length:585 start_codon:yes stop_codon:yes gene_type:complete